MHVGRFPMPFMLLTLNSFNPKSLEINSVSFFSQGKPFDILNPFLDKYNPHMYDKVLEINDNS
jgi:hypothetical protein